MEHALRVDTASRFLRRQEALHGATALPKSIASVILRLKLLLTDLSVACLRLKTAATLLTSSLWRLQSARRLACHIALLDLLLELVTNLPQ